LSSTEQNEAQQKLSKRICQPRDVSRSIDVVAEIGDAGVAASAVRVQKQKSRP